MVIHLPDVAAVMASLLPAIERDTDSANPAQTEAVALIRRTVALLARSRELKAEQLAISAELDEIVDRLDRLNAGVAAAPSARQ
jgi:hypothetical protein